MKHVVLIVLLFLAVSAHEKYLDERLLLTPEEKAYISYKKEIVVGTEPDYAPFSFSVTDKPSGYSVELLELLLKKSGLAIRHTVKPLNSLLNDAKNEKIDLLHSLFVTPQRKQYLNFSSAYLKSSDRFITHEDAETVEKIEDLFGKKVATVKGWYHEEFLEGYPLINRVYGESAEDLLDMVMTNQADATLMGSHVATYMMKKFGYKNMQLTLLQDGQYTPVDGYHFAVPKAQMHLIAILDKALDAIPVEEIQALNHKWFGLEKAQIFTAEELTWLKNTPHLRVCVRHNHFPVSGEKDGRLVGITGDVFTLISKELGLSFEALAFDSHDAMMEAIRTRQCEMISGVRRGFNRFEHIKTSTPVFRTNFAAMGNRKSVVFDDSMDLDGHTFYVKDAIQQHILTRHYPNIKVELHSDLDKIMTIIANDATSHYVNNFINIDHTIQKYGPDRFKVNGLLQRIAAHSSIGVDVEKNPLLLGILNKALAHIGEAKLREIVNEYKLKSFVINKDLNPYLLVTLGLVGVLLISALYYVRKLGQYQAALERERNTFRQIIDESSDGIHILDKEGRIVESSNTFAASLGYRKDELIGMHVSEWDVGLLEADTDAVRTALKKPMLVNTKHRRKDGSVFDVQVTAAPISIDDDIYLYASSRDISDSVELHRIRQLTADLELGQSFAKMASFHTDVATNEQRFSPSIARIFEIEDYRKFNRDMWISMIHPEDRQMVEERTAEIFENGARMDDAIRYRILPANGVTKWIDVRWTFIEEDYLIGYVQDVTERVLSEAKEQQYIDDLKQSYKLAKMSTWSFDALTMNFNFSPENQTLHGMVDTPVISVEAFMAYVHPDDVPTVHRTIMRSIEEDVHEPVMYRTRLEDGTVKWIFAEWIPMHDAAGSFVGAKGYNLDVTDKVHAEEKVKEHLAQLIKLNDELNLTNVELASSSEELKVQNEELMAKDKALEETSRNYQTLFDATPIPIVVYDEAKKVINSNTQFKMLFRTRYQVAMLNYYFKEGEFQRFIKVAQDEELLFSNVFYLKLKDGSIRRFTLLINENPVDETQKILMMIDVEDALQADERSKEQEALLFHQNRLAQQGEMLQMIGHQWRQPLMALSVKLEVINMLIDQETVNKAKIQESVVGAHEMIQFLSKTISDFKEFFSEDKEMQLFTPKSLVDDTLNILKERLDKHAVTIHTNYDETAELSVLGYRSELNQAILAIINNAIDMFELTALPHDLDITIKDGSSEQIVIAIEDNAGGIPDTVMPYIFDAYFSTKKDRNGTGLGLYMCKMIMEKSCGGTILVHNGAKGAVFTLTLPKRGEERSAGETIA
jgi:PAS domain S-box-containing protein